MQLIHLDTYKMLIMLFVLTPILQLLAVPIVKLLPSSHFSSDNWLYKTRKWEKNGDFYKKVFAVHKWKKFLPDGAKLFKGEMQKKHISSYDINYLNLFVKETAKAELIHWLGMLPFIIYFLLTPPLVALIMVLYAIIVNLPCIIAQRYNRPRLIKIIGILKKRTSQI